MAISDKLCTTPNLDLPNCETSIAITSPYDLPGHLCVNPDALAPATDPFSMRITPYFLSLLERADDALARQVFPDPRELQDQAMDADPLAEDQQNPAPRIIHRYPRRVIFLATNQCAVHCRFCMRKRRVGIETPISADAINTSIRYIQKHQEINEVIFSGGDPLMLSDAILEGLLSAIRIIPHVRILRLHTRIPCVWPQRITPTLAHMLSRFHPLYINIHFNHPQEITSQSAQACTTLADAGIPLGSQSVLLKGINDNIDQLMALFEKLLAIRVRPYYLHQIDRVPGTAHFQVPLKKSLALIQRLRGHLSGLGMPHLMVDLPGGGGKVELLPESKLNRETDSLVFKNFQGKKFRWPIT